METMREEIKHKIISVCITTLRSSADDYHKKITTDNIIA